MLSVTLTVRAEGNQASSVNLSGYLHEMTVVEEK